MKTWHAWRCFLCHRRGGGRNVWKATADYYQHYVRFHQDTS